MAPQLPAELEDLRNRICADWDFADKLFKPWWNHYTRQYQSYRVFTDWREEVRTASPRDRDAVIRDGQMMWDAELHIPYAYSTVETVLASMLAHRPRMLIQPRDEEALGNTDNMEFVIDSQQERIHYELVLQDIGKDGLIGGLGWQKMYWDLRTRKRNRLVKRRVPLRQIYGEYAQKLVSEVEVDDWCAERVEPGDMRWDPYAGRVEDCEYLIHRLWLSEKKIRQRVESGVWTLPEGWDLEDLLGVAKEGRTYSETFQKRNAASGLPDWSQSQRGKYEVWEYHDGEKVISILGRQVPVQIGSNPCWGGGYPFQAYRPTTAGNGLLAGIGEIEPIEHLIREMDTLRTQRRWNAALVLQQVLFYQIGAVDPDEILIGPGMLNGVNGDPNELIKALETREIPNSSYRESDGIEGDIDRTSGISDAVTGAGPAGGTATEAQLVRAAASTRIQNKARRIEVEIIKTGGEYAVELNQQKILTNRTIRVPLPPEPGEAERRWAWRTIAPSELMGKMSVRVEGGSTMAENVPQNRQDALNMANIMRGDPHIQQRKMWTEILKKMGYDHPEQWLVPDGPVLPPEVLQNLEDAGVNPELIQMAVEAAQQQNPTGGQPPAPNEPADPALEMAQQQ